MIARRTVNRVAATIIYWIDTIGVIWTIVPRIVPTSIPGTVPASIPRCTVPGVIPGVIPRIVPGVIPAPVIPALAITSPVRFIIPQIVIIEACHLLRQFEITFLHRIGIDTLLAIEIDDIDFRRVASNLRVRTLHTTIVLVDRTVTAFIIGILGQTVIIRHHIYTRLLGYEIEIIVLSHH